MEYKSSTPKLSTPCGSLYITIIFDKENNPIRVLPHFGKGGGCAQLHLSAICELISLYLESKTNAVVALSKLVGHSCHQNRKSCVDIMSRFIMDIILKKEVKSNDETKEE